MKNTMSTLQRTIKKVLKENGWTLRDEGDMAYLTTVIKDNPYDEEEIYSAFYSCIKEDVYYSEVSYQVQEAFFRMDEELRTKYPRATFVQLISVPAV